MGNLNALNSRQFFTLDFFVVKTKKMFSSHLGFPTNAIYHHRETKIVFLRKKCLPLLGLKNHKNVLQED